MMRQGFVLSYWKRNVLTKGSFEETATGGTSRYGILIEEEIIYWSRKLGILRLF